MAMKWQKLVIFMSISLFIVSCGKKKEAAKSDAPAATAAETKPAEPAPAPVATPAEANKKPEVKKEGRDTLVVGEKKVDLNDKKASANKPTKKESKPSASTSSSPSAPTGVKETNTSPVSSTKAEAGSVPLTGGTSTYGLLYTGSSQDAVLEKLAEMEAGKSADQVKLNKTLSKSIFDLAYLIDRTGQLTIDVTLKTSNRIEDHRFQMPFDAQSEMQLSHSGITVSALCIDAQPYSDDCSNLLVTIQKGASQAKAVLRQTKADLWFQYDVTDDQEFNQLAGFLRNSRLDYVTDERVETVYMNTYEVINGKSGYTAAIMGKAKQVIALKSDLLISNDLSAPLNLVDKVTDWNDINMFMAANGKDLKFMDLIKSASLVQNNGKGEITIEVVTESKSSKELHKVLFKMTRKDVATSF